MSKAMKIDEFMNECPECGSYDTELEMDEYTDTESASGKLNGIEELRVCRKCGLEWWNVYALVKREKEKR